LSAITCIGNVRFLEMQTFDRPIGEKTPSFRLAPVEIRVKSRRLKILQNLSLGREGTASRMRRVLWRSWTVRRRSLLSAGKSRQMVS